MLCLISHTATFLLLLATFVQCLPYNLSTGYTTTPSPFAAGGKIPPHARPFPRPYPPIPGLVMPPTVSLPPRHGDSGPEHRGPEYHHDKHSHHHTSSTDIEKKLDAFFKLAHSRMESGADIRALAAGLLPLYIQLCTSVGDECNAMVAELFRARYNDVQLEADRMDRLQLVLRRLARARGRWGKRPPAPKAAIRRMRRPHMVEADD